MADAGLFIGFGQAARAREKQALELFEEARAFYAERQQQGGIEGFEPVLLQPHGGELLGFFLIRGSQEQIDALRDDERFRQLNARATLVVDHFGVVPAYLGETMATQLDVYRGQLSEQLASG